MSDTGDDVQFIVVNATRLFAERGRQVTKFCRQMLDIRRFAKKKERL